MTFADWLRIRTEHDGNCVIWQQGLNSHGYPQGRWDNRPVLVARLVIQHRDKRPMSRKECAVAACGNRLCVSEICLKRTNRSVVMRRSYRSGARDLSKERIARNQIAIDKGWAKLDWQKVDEIRAKYPHKNITQLAQEYGMSQKAVSKVVRNLSWVRCEIPASVFQWRP